MSVRAGVLAAWVMGCGGGSGGVFSGAGGVPDRWPKDALTNYSASYGLGADLRSVGVDEAHNLWLVNGANQVGFLKSGGASPVWTSQLGQAGRGFTASTVCGGTENQAYVGYWAPDPENPYRDTPWTLDEPSPGDVDAVQLDGAGAPALRRHLNIFNSNDHHYNEVQGILTCARVMRGANKGDVYVGSNHAVTRIRGLDYSDHRHPVWASSDGTLHIGYSQALSITRSGEVLFGNDWKLGWLSPPEDLQGWIDFARNPWKLDTYVPQIGPQEKFAFWRGTAQTVDGRLYFASRDFGLWTLAPGFKDPGTSDFTQVTGLPSSNLGMLAATDDGSLFIATSDAGLWRRAPDGTLSAVAGVAGRRVLQLVYDPTASPSMLLALTDGGLFVLRGY